MKSPALLPCPRSLKVLPGTFTLPGQKPLAAIKFVLSHSAPKHTEGYVLIISKTGIQFHFRDIGGLHAATATMRQLLRQYGNRLPCLKIRDWPDFARRGVMLDVSRGRVPKLETLLELVEQLADFKINELQLYTEHTFAYRRYKSVWQSWGALTGGEIRKLDAHCRALGIDLVPNQNSFGHLRYFLEHPRLKQLAEVAEPYEDARGEFIRRPATLAPGHPGTLPFLRGLYHELLPNFSSRFFNVGCDETWDLGRGQSKRLCQARGQGRVYLDFLKKIHREVSGHGKTTMFWGDIILKHPELIKELANIGRDSLPRVRAGQQANPTFIALNWGYEANHPFDREAGLFTKAKIPFYVCPGTSTWQTLIGRHDNALKNLRAAAKAGRKQGALGYLITDWGDGGHPQPLAVSYLPILAGAALAWNAKGFDEQKLVPVLGRDIFGNAQIAKTVFKLGLVHRKLGVKAPNETPLGTVIAAPLAEEHELFCRSGLKWFTKIPAGNIRATLREIEKQRTILCALIRPRYTLRTAVQVHGGQRTARPAPSKMLLGELDLAARMAAQSCKFMLWQQAVASGKKSEAKRSARINVRELRQLEKDFNAYWPLRNKATPKHCSAFFQWRINNYQQKGTGTVP